MLNNKEEDKKKSMHSDAEELKEILSTVSTEIPGLIKNIIASVFSEEAGRSMGKAAAAFYEELKESGMPDDVALKMTQDYMATFTSLGDLLKQVGKGQTNISLGTSKSNDKED
jgi:hypothetical protein